MSRLAKYSCILLFSVLISAISQVMLKKSALKKYESRIKEYLNPLVIFSYGLFFLCTFISMYSLKVVPLSMAPVLEATSYIYVGVLSYIFLGEKMNKRQILGMALIIIGIVIFAL